MLGEQLRDVRERSGRNERRRRGRVLREEVTACSSTGRAVGSGSAGPVEPALAVNVIGDASAHERADDRRPRATGTSPRPASSSTLSAFTVVFSSVWLPWTVVMPSSSTSGLASASRMRDRVVVAGVAVEDDRRRHARSIVSTVAGVRDKLRDFALSFPGAVPEDHPWGEDVAKVEREDLRLPRAVHVQAHAP